MGGSSVLERIDEALFLQEALSLPEPDELTVILDEADVILDEIGEAGISILPTTVDERDLMISGLADCLLPVAAQGVRMPAVVTIGQRSLI